MKEISSFEEVQKKGSKLSLNKGVYKPLAAFICTFVIMLLVMALHNLIPLGTSSFLASDLKAQFAPNLLRLKHQILGLDPSHPISSFTYDATLGGGKNLMATFGYYMGSPLNLLVLLFDDSKIGLFISFTALFKMSLASAFMCLFLEKRASVKNTNIPLLFAITYAFTSHIIVYLFCVISAKLLLFLDIQQ